MLIRRVTPPVWAYSSLIVEVDGREKARLRWARTTERISLEPGEHIIRARIGVLTSPPTTVQIVEESDVFEVAWVGLGGPEQIRSGEDSLIIRQGFTRGYDMPRPGLVSTVIANPRLIAVYSIAVLIIAWLIIIHL